MGKITINELHNSLFDYVQTVSDNKLETNNKTIVGAINELFSDNSNDIEINNLKNEISNGKQLIASAIGEPLNAEDTFSAMSNDINGLLSQFKTNMMNNGITVESGDKFKSLIDKIATLADNEGNKVQFVTGFINNTTYLVDESTKSKWVKNSFTFDSSLDFTPTRLILSFPMLGLSQSVNDRYYLDNYTVDSQMCYDKNNYFHAYESNCNSSIELYITNISNTGFDLYANKYTEYYPLVCPEGINWLAIGVGEEDTTLSGGLDIISATELPETVVNNQIVLITETEPGAIKLIPNDLCIPSVDSEINIGYSTSTNSYNYTLSQGVSSLTVYLNVAKQLVSSTTSYIDGYIGLNNTWTQFSFSKNIVYDNGVDNLGISTASYWNRDENNGGWLTMTKNANNITIKLSGTGAEEYAGNKYLWCTKGIDFTNFNTCKVTYNYVDGTADMTFVIGPGYSSTLGVNQTLETTLNKDVTNGTMTYNISNLTGLYYIGAEGWANYDSGSDAILTITCIELTNN